ncbi:S6 family peptidase, partial [Escherichia coli]|uniref:S6 family peptidase n=1 Tax=Escherichia coli TaxID=562 RepID=UPI001BFC37F9
MNRIYSLRYSAVAKGFVAVYEFARKCVHKSVRRLGFPVLLLLPVLFSAGSLAGTVNNKLGYQLFLDFAENKGMFRPGEKNIAIYNKQGELVGTLDKAAMP